MGELGLPELEIADLRDAVEELSTALERAADKAANMLDDAINTVYEQAKRVQDYRLEYGTEGETGDITSAYERAVSTLRDAAREGQKQAASALKRLGEMIEPSRSKSRPHKR